MLQVYVDALNACLYYLVVVAVVVALYRLDSMPLCRNHCTYLFADKICRELVDHHVWSDEFFAH